MSQSHSYLEEEVRLKVSSSERMLQILFLFLFFKDFIFKHLYPHWGLELITLGYMCVFYCLSQPGAPERYRFKMFIKPLLCTGSMDVHFLFCSFSHQHLIKTIYLLQKTYSKTYFQWFKKREVEKWQIQVYYQKTEQWNHLDTNDSEDHTFQCPWTRCWSVDVNRCELYNFQVIFCRVRILSSSSL